MTLKMPRYKLTVGALYYALNELNAKGEFDPEGYMPTVKSPVIKSVSVTEETDNVDVYASGIQYDNVSQVAGTDIEIEVIAFEPEDLAMLRGETVEENGLIFGGGSGERPYVALGFPVIKKGDVKRYVWYPKCKLVENSNEVATSEESFDEQTDTLTFSALPFNDSGHNHVVLDLEIEDAPDIEEAAFFAKPILEKSDLVVGA